MIMSRRNEPTVTWFVSDFANQRSKMNACAACKHVTNLLCSMYICRHPFACHMHLLSVRHLQTVACTLTLESSMCSTSNRFLLHKLRT